MGAQDTKPILVPAQSPPSQIPEHDGTDFPSLATEGFIYFRRLVILVSKVRTLLPVSMAHSSTLRGIRSSSNARILFLIRLLFLIFTFFKPSTPGLLQFVFFLWKGLEEQGMVREGDQET